MLLIAQVFWLAAAATVAGILHMAVVKADLFAALRVPIDGGRTLGGKPIFGPNKTWRGLAFMVVGSAAAGALQGALLGEWAARSGAAPLDYGAIGVRAGAPEGLPALASGYGLVSAVLGLGYGLGELPNSFVKRRFDVEPGKTTSGLRGALFFLIDQGDSVVAALGLTALLFPLGLEAFLVGTLCLALFHLFMNAVLYLARLRRNL